MNAEQGVEDAHSLRWFKSSHSGSDGGDCVEVATSQAGICVRDSKRPDDCPLRFGAADWSALIARF